MSLPKLYFKKTHKQTKAEFVSEFSNKNCPDWFETPFGELHIRAGQRIMHWNSCMSDWHYEIVGWNVEGIENWDKLIGWDVEGIEP